MPTVHREAGFRFRFTSKDRPEPPHVHASGNGGKAKIWLTPAIRKQKSTGYSRRRLERIIRITEAHRDEWLAAWDDHFRGS